MFPIPVFRPKLALLFLASCLGLILNGGCLQKSDNEVVVYVALDKEFSKPILDQFEAETGVKVLAKYDIESNKTVGLANDILAHQANQRADIFWNNEILHTLRLKKAGLLDVHLSPSADLFPPSFRSEDGDWIGFAARARVLIVNTSIVAEDEYPDSVSDLANPKWKQRCGIAKPFFGTSATHAAVLFDQDPEAAAKFYEQVANNASIEGGNKQVAIKVARGELAFGLTDTDDAIIELEKGNPVSIIYPDQNDNAKGTLLIPNTLCVIKNGKNGDHARKLVDYLLQPGIEKSLRDGDSAQIPLNRNVEQKSRILKSKLKTMKVDFQSAADDWDISRQALEKIFHR